MKGERIIPTQAEEEQYAKEVQEVRMKLGEELQWRRFKRNVVLPLGLVSVVSVCCISTIICVYGDKIAEHFK